MSDGQELKRYARQRDVTQWRIAERLGVADLTLYRWQRGEVDQEKAEKIRSAIDALEAESGVTCSAG